MGRHSRRGPAPKSAPKGAPRSQPRSEPRSESQGDSGGDRGSAAPRGPQLPHQQGRQQPQGSQGFQEPRGSRGDGEGWHGAPPYGGGTPLYGTPARGVPRFPEGGPARGVPRFPDGTPAHGMPRLPDGTPAHGTPRLPDGTPAHGFPQVRGGHPEQREFGGGWGELGGAGVATGPQPVVPRQRPMHGSGPRPEYLDAFDEDGDVFGRRRQVPTAGAGIPHPSVADWDGIPGDPDDAPPTGEPAPSRGGKGRAFTGIAAAAVTTVLAVVVAGQVTDRPDRDARSQAAADQAARDARDPASRGDDRPSPSVSPSASAEAKPLTYEQKMDAKYALSATLDGSGKFDAVPGIAKAPGKGRKYTYRVDVEQGLGLDGELFAQAVQKTLNDDRSWAHSGARTFERIHSGRPDFVITLASPGTTADWCAKSGLDTTEDNVSCDSAATDRVMINAYRWAQGAETYGDDIHGYRQMLINHEIGHRLGYNHVTCDKNGELAPVMQQQTKFLDHDGIRCLPNPWPYPGS
ncbi:DUF3152 domain-containing protein [Streptomyces sp. NPDC018693]|uniref:DUF3152 domain-containing protein n=1 Tax=unclassified Streptomyces TaxID=2593676 RepID=UPI0037944146